MHAHAGRKQAAFRNTHTYTYIHTVTISSHSFVAAQLGFAAPSLRCIAQHALPHRDRRHPAHGVGPPLHQLQSSLLAKIAEAS